MFVSESKDTNIKRWGVDGRAGLFIFHVKSSNARFTKHNSSKGVLFLWDSILYCMLTSYRKPTASHSLSAVTGYTLSWNSYTSITLIDILKSHVRAVLY